MLAHASVRVLKIGGSISKRIFTFVAVNIFGGGKGRGKRKGGGREDGEGKGKKGRGKREGGRREGGRREGGRDRLSSAHWLSTEKFDLCVLCSKDFATTPPPPLKINNSRNLRLSFCKQASFF